MVRRLNGSLLPARFRAAPQVHLGAHVEADVAAFESPSANWRGSESSELGAATAVWAPLQPVHSLTVAFPDQETCEVRVLDVARGLRLVAAIKLVSPGNKDRPESRRAFTNKCVDYLHERVGLIVVDVVTQRHFNFHRDILEWLSADHPPGQFPDLYAAALRAQPDNGSWRLQAWPCQLDVSHPLPTLPLWLASELPIPIDLEGTYEETCKVLRIE